MFLEVPDYKRDLLVMINTFKITPTVAAYALSMTEFRGVDAALLWITEREQGVHGKMQHPFVGYIPSESLENFNENLDDPEAPLFSVQEICYICH